MKLILGSSSKYRKGLMEKAGYVFDVLIPEVDEKKFGIKDPYQRSLVLARAKMEILIPKVQEPAIIVTSDVVIACEGQLLEKPESKDEARKFLKKYSEGKVPEAICALIVYNTETKKQYESVGIASVSFKPFPEQMIEDFIKEGDPMERAGGFGVQHPLMRPYVDKIEGDEESIVGLPTKLLKKLLIQAGYNDYGDYGGNASV